MCVCDECVDVVATRVCVGVGGIFVTVSGFCGSVCNVHLVVMEPLLLFVVLFLLD